MIDLLEEFTFTHNNHSEVLVTVKAVKGTKWYQIIKPVVAAPIPKFYAAAEVANLLKSGTWVLVPQKKQRLKSRI